MRGLARITLGFAASTLVATLLGISPSAAATKISGATQDAIVKACVSNPALVWANPAAAPKLCACYVRNVVKAPDLMDAQRQYVLSFVAGKAASTIKAGSLSAERQDAAFQYFLGRRMEKGCVAR